MPAFKNLSYHRRLKIRRTIIAYVFLSATIGLMIIFTYYPMAYGVFLSFNKYDFLTPRKWVGLDNYRRILRDPLFWNAVKNSFTYLLVVPIIQFFSIVLAVLVEMRSKGAKTLRIIYALPMVTSMSVAAIAWQWIFQRQGILNYALLKMGLISQPVEWLTNKGTALFAIMFVTVWKGLGYYMYIYLAGLQGIPRTVIEASMIDGANSMQIFWRIKLPLLMPYILFNSLMSTMAALGIFTEVYVMTGGGPGHLTETIPMLIYKEAFENLKFGYASALSLLFGFVLLTGVIINFLLLRKGWTRPDE